MINVNVNIGMTRTELNQTLCKTILRHSTIDDTSLPGGQDFEDAVTAATEAFWNAILASGSGLEPKGVYSHGKYLAKANLDTEELELYKKIL